MKQKIKLIIVLSLIVVCGVSTAAIFLTVNEFNPDRLKEPVFWIAFSFAVPVNVLAAIILHLWAVRKGSNDIVHLPVIYYVIAVFGVAYLAAGYGFIYKYKLTNPTIPLVVEMVITAAYFIVALFAMLGTNFITDTQREVKEKVLYVRMLQADVNDCKAKATTPAIARALERFAQNVECSDPMSHPSLAGIESSLTSAVKNINSSLDMGLEEAEIIKMIADAEALLDSRNRRCIMLK
ncbi:MAG: hypothetical protein IJX30_02110 [Clostridia bacterium]|nr:hypothetical protein [Clostridia bacterium]